MKIGSIEFFSFKSERVRVLHATWFAFFLSFVVWFNLAPIMPLIRKAFTLSDGEVAALLVMNVALAIPARIVVGMLVDKLGPRLMYSGLLVFSGLVCFAFALSDTYASLAISRLLLGTVGAGFVIGIRLIGEWFPARETGLAQGLYAGLGNFGSAAAAATLPSIAAWYGGDDGWRWALATTGGIAVVYGIAYYLLVSNTPKGATYFSPKKTGSLEISSRSDAWLFALVQLAIPASLAFMAWRMGPAAFKIIPMPAVVVIWLGLAAYYLLQIFDMLRINRNVIAGEAVAEIHAYRFSQVAALSIAYLITFGSELAVISILPLFFAEKMGFSLAMAGLMGASFGATTFFARPFGGWFSDTYGRKLALMLCFSGAAIGYFAMSYMGPETGAVYAVAVTFMCSLFINAGNGATYAMLPLIKRRLTGQIAGLVGAYGNIGSVVFLLIFAQFGQAMFFVIAAASAAVGAALILLVIREPRGQLAEIMPDGSLALIDVK